MNLKVSIIIPTYNNLKNLRLCIDSIKKQTFLNYEVWIIDGNSTDKTKDFLQNLKEPFYWISEKDYGIYQAMNKGIFFAKGDWLCFLGADDILYNNKVLQSIFSLNIPIKTSFISGKITYNKKSFLNKEKKPSWSFLMWIRNGIHHQGTFYRKELFFENKYDESFQVLADYAFNLQLFQERKKCLLLHQTVAICGANGISKNVDWVLYKEELKLKMALNSNFLFPLFYILVCIKFFFKKINSYI